MTSTPAGAGRDRPAAGEHPDWVALVAFAVVIIALLTLAVVPAVLIQRMSRGTET